jgi:hypothetical protein
MKGYRALILFMVTVGLVSCVGPRPFNIDKDIWAGTATCPENQTATITLTFSNVGETVEAVLQQSPNPSTRTLTGTLKGTTLDISTETKDPSVTGDFNPEAKTFVGTLQFPNGATTIDCTLTMNYQGEQETGIRN